MHDEVILSDSFFKKGESHQVCEDYAYASFEGFAILSDGCSSAPDTDFGSRLLVRKKAEQFRKKLNDDLGLVWSCLDIVSNCGVSDYSLTATLGYVIKDNHGFHVNFLGDGVIVARDRESKKLEVITLEYSNNAPYYLAYEIKPIDKINWMAQYDSELIITKNFIDDGVIDSNFLKENIIVDSDFMGFSTTFPSDKYDMVILMTDGIESFNRLERSILPYGNSMRKQVTHLELIAEIFKFQGDTSDIFINKPFTDYMQKYANRDLVHYDDLAMAGIYCP